MRTGRYYLELRGEMVRQGISNADIAARIGKSQAHVSRCLNLWTGWDCQDMYAIMDMIGRPYSDLHVIFPKDGVAQQEEAPKPAKPKRPVYRLIKMG